MLVASRLAPRLSTRTPLIPRNVVLLPYQYHLQDVLLLLLSRYRLLLHRFEVPLSTKLLCSLFSIDVFELVNRYRYHISLVSKIVLINKLAISLHTYRYNNQACSRYQRLRDRAKSKNPQITPVIGKISKRNTSI